MAKTEQYGAGLDIGTMNIVSARREGNKVKFQKIRDAFVDLPPEKKRFLKVSETSYVEFGGRLLVLGDAALQVANLFNQEAKRPMSGGVLSSGELDAQQVLGLIMKEALGEPRTEKEKCAFSVPAVAIDVPGSDIIYHRTILAKILTELGYTPIASNEAQAIILSECAKEQYSGLGISYGAGMTNVSLCYSAMSALEFSLGRGGDWADSHAARAVSKTASKITALKEDGINIFEPKDRDSEAIGLYLRTLIDYTIDNLIAHFHNAKNELMVPKPIPIVVGGGTSLAGGFMDLFRARFEINRARFPIQISEIRHAEDPLYSVATGLLLAAQMED
jgi:hypothetical protein